MTCYIDTMFSSQEREENDVVHGVQAEVEEDLPAEAGARTGAVQSLRRSARVRRLSVYKGSDYVV